MVTTTVSIENSVLRCSCGRRATGDVLLQDENGRWLSWCCASESMKVVLRTMIPAGTVVSRPDAGAIVGIDPLGRFAGVAPSVILAAQGVEQTPEKRPRRDEVHEEPPEVPEDGTEAYQSRFRNGPHPDDLARHHGTVRAPEPAYGSNAVVRGMAYRRPG